MRQYNAYKLMPKNVKLHAPLIKTARIHYLFAGLFSLQLILFDSSMLITPDVVMKRWLAIGALLAVVIVVNYQAHAKNPTDSTMCNLFWGLIISDIAFASFMVYLGRGMASRAVALYFIPIAVSAILLSHRALVATALISAVCYVLTALLYFTLNFNEGYKVELYGETLFYGGVMLAVSSLSWIAIKTKKKSF